MQIQPYLFYEGRCEEAIEFYKKAVGAEVLMLMRYKDNPDKNMPAPANPNNVMHAALRVGESTLLASDGECKGKANLQGFSLALIVQSEGEADWAFAGLADGGKVHMPLTKTFFSPRFGMVADKFGVMWMVLVRQ
jgi:PhnB protein